MGLAIRITRLFAVLAAVLLGGLLLAPVARAVPAAQDQVQVSLSNAMVKLGEPVSIYVRVEGDAGVKIAAPPEVKGLRISNVVSKDTSQRIGYDARGRPVVERTTIYRLVVEPTGLGTYSIPPLKISVDGKVVTAPDEPMKLEVVADIEASQLLLFERGTVPTRVYEGEPYEIELRFGWDVSRQFADAELQLPWWERQEGVIELDTAEARRGSHRIAIRPGRRDAQIEELRDVERDGRRFKVYRLRRRYVATRSGTVEFGRSLFKFAELVGRSSGVFTRGRTRSYYAPVEPFSIEVLPVPEVGRPLEWTGAVGRIEASRDAPRRDVDLGDVIELQVRWTGDGNLEFFDPPDLSRIDAFDRFRVLGVEDEKSTGERIVTYDLVPLDAGIEEIPPVPLSVFDTETREFVEVRTDPLRVRVLAVGGAGEDPFGGTEEREEEPIVLRDIVARPVGRGSGSSAGGPGSSAGGPGAFAWLAVFFLAFFGWIALRRAVRRRGDPTSAEARRRRLALRRLSTDVRGADSPAELSGALEAFLARRTGESHEAWIGRAHLADAGHGDVSDELEERYSSLRSDLDRAVFGGEDENGVDADRVVEFARAAVKEGL